MCIMLKIKQIPVTHKTLRSRTKTFQQIPVTQKKSRPRTKKAVRTGSFFI